MEISKNLSQATLRIFLMSFASYKREKDRGFRLPTMKYEAKIDFKTNLCLIRSKFKSKLMLEKEFLYLFDRNSSVIVTEETTKEQSKKKSRF